LAKICCWAGVVLPAAWASHKSRPAGSWWVRLSAAPLLDPDGDGQNNTFEFTAGFIPTVPLSRFSLNIVPVPGQPGQKQVIFDPIVAGRKYTVMTSLDLTPGADSCMVV
jgi:hypothetical protein